MTADYIERKSDGLTLLARTIGTDLLRTLDALHLAAAVSVGAEQMLTYDERLSEAHAEWGWLFSLPASFAICLLGSERLPNQSSGRLFAALALGELLARNEGGKH